MKHLLSLLFILFCTQILFAQDDSKPQPDSLDVLLQKRLDSSINQTTLGMVSCEVWAKGAWDAQLNKYYRLLMGLLSAAEKEKLKASQVNWLKYRDSEYDFISALYGNMQGTMWRPAAVGAEVEIVRQRALELKAYYSDKSTQ
jgi:uncharacterized protein YecT (DUF1311 family)